MVPMVPMVPGSLLRSTWPVVAMARGVPEGPRRATWNFCRFDGPEEGLKIQKNMEVSLW